VTITHTPIAVITRPVLSAPQETVSRQLCMTLHTRLAQRLFTGEWQKGVVKPCHVPGFSSQLNRLTQSVKQGHPAAKQTLVLIDRLLDEARQILHEKQQHYQRLLSDLKAIRSHFAKTCKRSRLDMPLSFNSTAAYRVACLIGDYDYLVYLSVLAERNARVSAHWHDGF